MRILGVLLAVVGLIIVGMSGDNKRKPANGLRLTFGLVLMLAGILVALFATRVALMMGWQHP